MDEALLEHINYVCKMVYEESVLGDLELRLLNNENVEKELKNQKDLYEKMVKMSDNLEDIVQLYYFLN